ARRGRAHRGARRPPCPDRPWRALRRSLRLAEQDRRSRAGGTALRGGAGMTDLPLADEAARPPIRRASLGGDDGEDIFATFDQKILQRILGFVGPHRKQLIWSLCAVLLSTISGLGMPWIMHQAISSVVRQHNPRELDLILLAFGAFVVMSTLAQF